MAVRSTLLAMLVLWSAAVAHGQAAPSLLRHIAYGRYTTAKQGATLAMNEDSSSRHRARPWSARRKLALASWLFGGALVGVSIATGVGTFEDMRPLTAHHTAERLDVGVDVLVGVGAAGLITGTALWLFGSMYSEHARTRASLRLRVSTGCISLHGRF